MKELTKLRIKEYTSWILGMFLIFLGAIQGMASWYFAGGVYIGIFLIHYSGEKNEERRHKEFKKKDYVDKTPKNSL